MMIIQQYLSLVAYAQPKHNCMKQYASYFTSGKLINFLLGYHRYKKKYLDLIKLFVYYVNSINGLQNIYFES